ncbi:MAG: DNA helicase RecQ [Anaerolineales bacterium]|nr:DNA helicase RecQ [Anaerolineales bacterium]
MTQDIDHLLHEVFGYQQFKLLQREIIENILAHRDTLMIMPTGGGKSLCYQLPALVFPGITVVVSPLISLMKDQVDALNELGIPAIYLNSSLSYDEHRANLDRIRKGEVRLVYIAPEGLLVPATLAFLAASAKVDCLAIDEAHCISEWGHDFRPEYRQLVQVRQKFPQAVCVALTATATPRVRLDIKNSLGFQDADEFITSFNRENLFLEVLPKKNPTAQVIRFLRNFPEQSGIIYCFSRQQVDDLAVDLAEAGFSVRPYHAGLNAEQRQQNQEAFIHDDVQIMIATIAFGMGINKPNVRFVIHYDLPKSLEGYYQEIGRAGRDGLPSHCLLLYSYADTKKQLHFIDQKDEPERSAARMHLRALTDMAETSACRRAPLLAHFGETYTVENCAMCDNCRGQQGNQEDVTIPAQKFISCVKRTGERYGATYITHVLMGILDEKVQQRGHQSLSTFGIGTELSRKEWLSLARLLVQRGLLTQETEFRVLKLSPAAYEWLKSKQPLLASLRRAPAREAEAEPRESEVPGAPDYDHELFERLRRKRKQLADASRLPPFIIFSDKTLVEMAAYFPQSMNSLEQINGIGQVKLAHYGQAFLDVLLPYCQERKLVDRARLDRRGARVLTKPGKVRRYIEVGRAYQNGRSIPELMADYDVKQSTILSHLYQFILAGNSLLGGEKFQALSCLTAQQQERVLSAFHQYGTATLRPIFDALNAEIGFDELNLLRLHYLINNQHGSKV